MTDANVNTQPFQSLDGAMATSTIAVTLAAAVGAAGALAVVGDQQASGAAGNVGRPFGELYADVLNASTAITAISFTLTASPVLAGFPTTGGAYVMAAGERRTFLVPPNVKYIQTYSTAASGTVYATVGKGRA